MKKNLHRALMATALATVCLPRVHAEDPKVETNVVYGMISGLALLMDVYYPEKPNGYGVLFISGSGWSAPLSLSARPLKQSRQAKIFVPSLTEAGYTVFGINHRAIPRFQLPDILADVQRAARFIRHHAEEYKIDAHHISGVAGSSGGHLISLIATMDDKGNPDAPDPVDRESAKLQCIVARAAPFDLANFGSARGTPVSIALLLGMAPRGARGDSIENRTYREASPISHVSPDDPPFLLLHGDKDVVVPYKQSVSMEKALKEAGVEAKLLTIPGAGHGPTFPGAKDPPDYLGETVRWLNDHLPSN